MATTVVLRPPLAADGVYFQTYRPWLALYGLRLKVPGSSRQTEDQPLSLIQRLLPDDMLLLIFSKLPVYSLGAAQNACAQWHAIGNHPSLWQKACLDTFRSSGFDTNCRLVRSQYRGSWKAMFLERPHLRLDGIYVSRNTYIRTGLVEWRVRSAAHLVAYYRYYRFLADGSFLYRTSPEVLARVARTLHPAAAPQQRDRAQQDGVQLGRYRLNGERLLTKMVYPNSQATEIRARLRLRSTVAGANNRLDVESIVSFDRAAGTELPVHGAGNGEDDEIEAEALRHRRGLSCFVFVPRERVADSPLNLPVHKMDFYLPG